ncbi:MAG: adenosylcobinamide-GDP ribazoletransferase, partial [Pseudomonadota bacterium]
FDARNELKIFALAVQFLTRLPVPIGDAYTPERQAATPRYYVLVGALIGALCGVIYLTTYNALGNAIAALLAIAAGLLVTGAFHEDGLADTFDGLGANSRERMLEIMRDSRIGTFGALALVMMMTLKATAIMRLDSSVVVLILIVGHGLSRLSAVIVISTSQYARDHGTGKPTADGIDTTSLFIALVSGAALLLCITIGAGLGATLAVATGALLGHVGMRVLFERRLQGYTGDTLGAVQQTTELGIYLGLLWWQ